MTMSSGQLGDVIIPVPKPALQEEVVESHVIATKASAMIGVAASLRDSSSDEEVVQLAERVIRETEELLRTSKKRVTISAFLPS